MSLCTKRSTLETVLFEVFFHFFSLLTRKIAILAKIIKQLVELSTSTKLGSWHVITISFFVEKRPIPQLVDNVTSSIIPSSLLEISLPKCSRRGTSHDLSGSFNEVAKWLMVCQDITCLECPNRREND